MDFKVTYDIPLPHQNPYPFDEVQAGGSFFVPFDLLVDRDVQIARFASLLHKWGRKHDQKWIYRSEATGLRCWRER